MPLPGLGRTWGALVGCARGRLLMQGNLRSEIEAPVRRQATLLPELTSGLRRAVQQILSAFPPQPKPMQAGDGGQQGGQRHAALALLETKRPVCRRGPRIPFLIINACKQPAKSRVVLN
jgi:hypothetical protein